MKPSPAPRDTACAPRLRGSTPPLDPAPGSPEPASSAERAPPLRQVLQDIQPRLAAALVAPVDIASLAAFRVLFGVMMMAGALKGLPAKLLEGLVLALALAVSSYACLALTNLSLSSLTRGSRSWELSLPLALPQAFVALGMGIFACAFATQLLLLFAGRPVTNPETPE